jgi:hypothetical protein
MRPSPAMARPASCSFQLDMRFMAAYSGPLDGLGRAEIGRAPGREGQVQERAQRLRRDDRAEDVGGSGGVLPGQGVVLDQVREHAPFGC